MAARATLDSLPPLSSTMESVLQRCGPGVDLLLETVSEMANLYTHTSVRLMGTYYLAAGARLMEIDPEA